MLRHDPCGSDHPCDRRFAMDTPAEPATHANHGIDWDYVEAHHHPVTLVRRPAYEGWVLTLFGLILVGLMGLLGWTGDTAPRVTALEQHPREKAVKPPPPSPLPALPPATQLPRDATSAPRTP